MRIIAEVKQRENLVGRVGSDRLVLIGSDQGTQWIVSCHRKCICVETRVLQKGTEGTQWIVSCHHKCIWVETRVLQKGTVRSEEIVDGNRDRMKRDAAIAAVRQDQDAECTGAECAGACGKAQLETHGHA